MAIKVNTETNFGEVRDIYIRVNNVEVSNHGVKATALLRGFVSKDAFESGAHYVSEDSVEFDADVTQPLWEQAYTAAKSKFAEWEDC